MIYVGIFDMSCKKVFLVVAFLLFFIVFIPSVFGLTQDEVADDIFEAESVLNSTYEMVLDVENVGANISVLVGKLNLCSDYLSQGIVAYNEGSYDDSSYLVGMCTRLAEDVQSEAFVLKEDAEDLQFANLLSSSVGSLVGVIVVIIFGFLIWRIFKFYYLRNVLKSGPKVNSNES